MSQGYQTINSPQVALKDAEKKTPPAAKRQSQQFKAVADSVFNKFEQMRINRDRGYSYFRERNIVEYVSDSQERFNNYKRKPDWKEPWQANISDITTHSKLMAMAAVLVANRLVPKYYPRFSRNLFATVKASIYQSIAEYITTVENNGEIDDMFITMLSMRDGTCQQFLGYQENEYYKGIDARFIPVEEGYPGDMKKFDTKDQPRFIWRVTQQYDVFKANHQGSNFIDVNKVSRAGTIYGQYDSFFNITRDLSEDQVEKLILWDKVHNEFAIVANGILITKPGMKLTDVNKDREIPVIKWVSEAYDPHFYYGRSVPDLMKDNQDAIDFLFNAMFDKEILAVMRPVLVGGVNDLLDDFWSPGAIKKVMDVTQVKELNIQGADLNAFRILKELQDRNVFASIDPSAQGISLGRGKTATEVERVNQAQRLKTIMSNILLGDGQIRKHRLLKRIIKEKYLKNNKFEPFIVENTGLSNGKTGTRSIEITDEIPEKTQFGFSPQLFAENAMIPGESEVIKMSEKEFENFEVDIKIDLDVPMSRPAQKAAVRDYVATKLPVAFQRPDLLNPLALLKKEAEVTDGIDWNEIRGEQESNQNLPTAEGEGALPTLDMAANNAGQQPAMGE